MSVDLHPHQIKVLEKLDNGKILCGDVGTGKSITSVAYFFLKECQGGIKLNGKGDWVEMKTPKDLYILTTANKRDKKDWEVELARFGLNGKSRENNFGHINVVVDSWNNIEKYINVKDAFFILDEQRLVGYGKWSKSFIKISKNNRWILLTATPGDQWIDYMVAFIGNGYYKNKTDFVSQHVVYTPRVRYDKIQKYLGQAKLARLRKQILVEMPYDRKTERHRKSLFVGYDHDSYDFAVTKRKNPYDKTPIRDISGLCAILRKIVCTESERLDEILKVLKDKPQSIIFYNYDYELDILRGLSKHGYKVSEYNGHKHQALPHGKKWVYLVQYTAGAEGWNCITTDTIIFYSLNYSYRMTHQSEGRIDRLNTPFINLYYYYIRSNAPIDVGVWKALKMKKKFNEKSFTESYLGKDPFNEHSKTEKSIAA